MDDLRTLRMRAGLTQQELARRSGVAQPNIAAYESGRRNLSRAMRDRLLHAMKPTARDALERHREDVARILLQHKMSNPRVFGSSASQTDTPSSDVDLLVDAQLGLDLLDIIDAADELENLLGVPVDIITSRSLYPGHEIFRTAIPV